MGMGEIGWLLLGAVGIAMVAAGWWIGRRPRIRENAAINLQVVGVLLVVAAFGFTALQLTK